MYISAFISLREYAWLFKTHLVEENPEVLFCLTLLILVRPFSQLNIGKITLYVMFQKHILFLPTYI